MRHLAAFLTFLLLTVGVQGAQALEIIYFKAADCPHCARFEAQELPEYQASRLSKRVRIRPIDVGTFRANGTTVRQLLPADLAFIKNDPMQALGGTPRSLVIDKQQVIYNGFGRRVFKAAVVPYVESLR